MEEQISQIVLPEHNPKTKDLLASPVVYDFVVMENLLGSLIRVETLTLTANLMEWHALSTTEKCYFHVKVYLAGHIWMLHFTLWVGCVGFFQPITFYYI